MPLIIKEIQVQGIPIKALINYGSSVNIISKRTVQRNKLLVQQYPEPYQIVGISNKIFMPGKQVIKQTKLIKLILQKYTKTISLNINNIASHNIILGKPWL